MEAKAALVESPDGPFVITDVTIADPQPGEILVRITAAGICHTDLSTKSVWPDVLSPMVFGHEGAGIVEAVGPDVTSVAVGDSVSLSYRSCGECDSCSEGAAAYCTKFQQLNVSGGRGDGTSALSVAASDKPVFSGFFGQSSFATYAISYETNTVKVPADIPAAVAAPLGCSVQTGAGAVLNVLKPEAGESFALFGAGAVGLAAVMAAATTGCAPIIVVDPIADRRAIAGDLGATHIIDPTTTDDVAATIRDITNGGAHTALDTTAIPAVINQAIGALRPKGACALVGIGAPDLTINSTQVIASGITIRGVIEGDATPAEFVPRLVELYKVGKLPIEKLISEYTFTDIDTAASDAAAGRVIKPILTFEH
ncbi:NAD(P)-dependent alcohol dehydrogenase [Rhodococcus erythropolis]|uniref:NAD(P)-dependent alcohol dehydrogenase n=1 Tax=Rhodococcus erythropolis TaxID=1833 RepID=UPI0022280C13|nr:NAD(P)-dependent alcohol dehydrogenase [Rhodococcus erythropolis]MCW2295465.1 aryl-alcohol dehydrogenase [Rhodococcus erythropolis]